MRSGFITWGLISLLFIPRALHAQTQESPWMAGLSAIFLDYKGLMTGDLTQVRSFDPGITIGAYAYLNKSLNFAINSSFVPEATYPISEVGTFIGTSLIDVNALVHIKSNNGKFLDEDAVLAPYLTTGMGFNTASNQFRMYIPAGLGLRVQVSDNFSLQAEAIYKQRIGVNKFQHLAYSAGFVFALPASAPPPPPPPPPPPKSSALADRDQDGTPDRDDLCPDEKGKIMYLGCPDKAPPVAVQPQPPKEPNPSKQNSGDVVIEDEPMQFEEVDVTDGDGDAEALVSDDTGTGTPAKVSEGDIRLLEKAMDNIFFETGSDQLTPESLKILDTVSDIMARNPAYILVVTGHTDNTGPDRDNHILSVRRAFKVKYFLVNEKHISQSRINCDGYSSKQPVSDNATENGRRMNRRVDLKLVLPTQK